MVRLDVGEQTDRADRTDFPVPGSPMIRTPVMLSSANGRKQNPALDKANCDR